MLSDSSVFDHMTFNPYSNSFESIRTPLIITDRNGLVIFRNKAFASHFRKPRRGGNIFKQIGENQAFDDVFPDGLPAYSSIEKITGTGMNISYTPWRSFVYQVEPQDKSNELQGYLIWLFPRRFITASPGQVDSLLSFYAERLGTLRSLLWNIYQSPNIKEQRPLPYSRSPESVFDAVSVDDTFKNRKGSYDLTIYLSTFFSIFSECVTKQLSIRGFRFEPHYQNLRVGETLTIAGGELAALCVQLIYAALLLSKSHQLIMDCFYTDSKLSIVFTAPISEGTKIVTASGSILDAAAQYLDLAIELYFCDLLWNAPGRRIIWESSPERVELRAECALESPNFVMLRSASKLTREDLIEKINELIKIII